MNNKLLAVFAMGITVLSLTVFSCQKNDDLIPGNPEQTSTTPEQRYVSGLENAVGREGEPACPVPATEVTLFAGQTINSGTVSVSNDSAYIYVTYTTTNGWTLWATHLYVGDCALIPVNNPGNPIPGQFPYKATHSGITSYTYQVPISAIPEGSCGCIAAHAVVKNGGQTQTGWGNGSLINLTGGNWGMKFDFCPCPSE